MRFLVLAMLVTGMAAAQPMREGGGGFPWWDSPIVRDLNLSEDQQQQIRATVRDYRNKLIEARAATQKAEAELNDVYDDTQVDQRKASEAIEHLVAARSELTRTFSQMSLRLRSVLTLDQWRELQKRRQEMRPERGPFGPGAGPMRGRRTNPEPPPPPKD